MGLPKNVFRLDTIKSLSITALSIWLVTNLTCTLFGSLFDFGPVLYCAIGSFLLSLLAVLLLSDSKMDSTFRSWFSVLFSSFILYFSANGFQAFYAAIQAPAPDNTDETAELIPFLSSKPWLPPMGISNDLVYYKDGFSVATENNIALTTSLDSATYLLESCGLMTDSIFLTVIPDANEVANGGMYRSEVVLAAKLDKSYVKRVTVNDEELELADGVAIFEEKSSMGSGYANIRNLDYRAEIELYGEEQIVSAFDSYKIIRPYIEVSSQAVNSLFLGCGNKLSIQVPILGKDYNPRFTVEGGDFRYGRRKGELTVVPRSQKVTVNVFNNGVKLGDRSFPVRRVPSPKIEILYKKKKIDLTKGISPNVIFIKLVAKPDDDFARMFPDDGTYKVHECEITLTSRGILKGRMKGGEQPNISNLIRNAKPGDQVTIEIKTLLRKNFKGDVEKVVNFNPQVFTMPIK